MSFQGRKGQFKYWKKPEVTPETATEEAILLIGGKCSIYKASIVH